MFLLFPIVRRLTVLAIVLAIPLLAGEFVARKLLGDAVRSAVAARLGGAPAVSFGSTPVLWQLVHGRLSVSVTEPRVELSGLPPVSLTGQLDDIHLTSLASLQGAIGAVSVTATIGADGVRDLLATPACVESLPAGLAAGLTLRPRVMIFPGHVSLLGARGRVWELRLRPLARDGDLVFAVVGAREDGRSLAGGSLQAVAAALDCRRDLGALPFGVRLAGAGAVNGSVTLDFVARNASFSAG